MLEMQSSRRTNNASPWKRACQRIDIENKRKRDPVVEAPVSDSLFFQHFLFSGLYWGIGVFLLMGTGEPDRHRALYVVVFALALLVINFVAMLSCGRSVMLTMLFSPFSFFRALAHVRREGVASEEEPVTEQRISPID